MIVEQNTSLIPNSVTKTMLCIDAVTGADFSGVLYNPFMPEPVPFEEATGAIGIMEKFFNGIAYPQSYFEDRSFLGGKGEEARVAKTDVTRYHEDNLFDEHSGKIATFLVTVRYRQNATWQGDITWREEGKTHHFRSALEMLRLIDLALDRQQINWDS